MPEDNKEYCPHCGDFYPVDTYGDIDCDCEVDPYADDVIKPLDFS